MALSTSTSSSDACRICGYSLGEPPWGDDGTSPAYVICHCCGAEAGVDDQSVDEVRMYRNRWRRSGMKWFRPHERPKDWNLDYQLERVPAPYR